MDVIIAIPSVMCTFFCIKSDVSLMEVILLWEILVYIFIVSLLRFC